MVNRREFIKGAMGLAIAVALPISLIKDGVECDSEVWSGVGIQYGEVKYFKLRHPKMWCVENGILHELHI